MILGDHNIHRNVETQALTDSWNFMGMVSPLSSDEEGHLARSGHKLAVLSKFQTLNQHKSKIWVVS